ncbi:two-component system, chemotaxis family, sensor kinase CheA [Bacillus sp. OV166]|uniref:response regulator n=1 Tax=Bacillus sp. OV166 TaxID=1882763 RepID=UPI000A2AC4AB|nr:response regulator [Bacillus sp. OV166]SMQ86712.1 two-component system, chemotaxis family, sensor kinase CheA [Bacillus sp. OV166]
MKFKTQLFLAFGIIYGIYAILHVYLWQKMDHLDKEMNSSTKSYNSLTLTNTIHDELNVYSKASRELFSNPPIQLKEQFLKNRDRAIQNINNTIFDLQKLDTSDQTQELINNLKASIESYEEIQKERDRLLKEDKSQEVTKLYWLQGQKVSEKMLEISIQLLTLQSNSTNKQINNSNKDYYAINSMTTNYVLLDYVIGALMLFWLLWNVTRRLNHVSSVMGSVNFDRLDKLPRIMVKTKDEIGKIAISYNEMAQELEKHTRQEQQLKIAAEEQSWLKTKVAEIATMYPGIANLETLAHLFITKIAPMVGANYGVFYIKQSNGNEEYFQKLAGYAHNNQLVGTESFKLGEGIVGQSALDNQMTLLKNVPENYINISSSIGKASPAEVIILPAEFEGEVLAIIELASFASFSKLDQMMLKEVMSNLGINIKSISRHIQVEMLLEESQALTEELQSQSEELHLQQEELRNVNEQLEDQYEDSEQKTKELENIQTILEEKAQQLTLSSQYKSEFLANMSHELRTPLNSLLILAQILAENAEENLTSKQITYAETIFSSGNDLLQLISDILDIAKVEAGKMEISIKEVSISDIKDILEAQFIHVARNKSIEFNIEIASDMPKFIYTDKLRLEQILKNLLSNAFKFTNDGSVSLIINKAEKGTYLNKNTSFIHSEIDLEFSVKDTGIGISLEKYDIIFDAFKQADGTINRKFGGTGLGLSISRELSHLLGGFIEVESIEGTGSTFTLYLPNNKNIKQSDLTIPQLEIATAILEETNSPVNPMVFSSKTEENSTRMFDKKALLAGKKILVVDDDVRNIFAITTALENYQVEVMFSENGIEGISTLQSNPDIDLVLMDIMMPDMDGFEAIKLLRQMPDFENIPIIALTAKAMKYDRDQCIAAGASDYISKPVNLKQLISMIRVWLYR